MESTVRAHVERRRLRLAAAGALVVMALTVTTAASAPLQDAGTGAPAPGFLLERGRYTTVAIPRRLAPTAPLGIVPTGINDRGQIVGFGAADLAAATFSGFLLDKGRFTAIARPGATSTAPFGLNDRGQVVGAAA